MPKACRTSYNLAFKLKIVAEAEAVIVLMSWKKFCFIKKLGYKPNPHLELRFYQMLAWICVKIAQLIAK